MLIAGPEPLKATSRGHTTVPAKLFAAPASIDTFVCFVRYRALPILLSAIPYASLRYILRRHTSPSPPRCWAVDYRPYATWLLALAQRRRYTLIAFTSNSLPAVGSPPPDGVGLVTRLELLVTYHGYALAWRCVGCGANAVAAKYVASRLSGEIRRHTSRRSPQATFVARAGNGDACLLRLYCYHHHASSSRPFSVFRKNVTAFWDATSTPSRQRHFAAIRWLSMPRAFFTDCTAAVIVITVHFDIFFSQPPVRSAIISYYIGWEEHCLSAPPPGGGGGGGGWGWGGGWGGCGGWGCGVWWGARWAPSSPQSSSYDHCIPEVTAPISHGQHVTPPYRQRARTR